jgi:hypothetical protein
MPAKKKPVKTPETEEVARCARSGNSIRRGRVRCDQCAWSQKTYAVVQERAEQVARRLVLNAAKVLKS